MGKKIQKKHIKNQSNEIRYKLKEQKNRIENNTFIFHDDLSIAEFAKAINKPVIDILKIYFNKGIMTNQNSILSEDKIGELCLELNLDFKKEKKITIENLVENFNKNTDETKMKERPPIVTIMGHVDHGKTSLLDNIRKSRIVQSEKGGITQAIGAYQIDMPNKKKITFIDTPGHELFTEMRIRGSQSTDIVVLVVSGEEGIKPQTIEAIDHAKAANVEIIVFVNKSDRPNYDIEKVKSELSNHDLMPEEWGGNVTYVKGSAKTGEGIDELLENILLIADVMELKANEDEFASGIVIESSLDKFLGPKATLLVKNGLLKTKDFVIAGYSQGKIRLMKNDKNKVLTKAGPSTPVTILGLNDVPKAGDHFMCFFEDKLSKKIANERKNAAFNKIRTNSGLNNISFETLTQNNKSKMLNIILRADTFGSIEALKNALSKLDNDEVKINIIRSTVGTITDSDITLAIASNAFVFGFNVRPNANVHKKAENNQVKIRLYSIIYELIEEVENLIKGMSEPVYEEKIVGQAEVRKTFKHSDIGTIAGCLISNGSITNNSNVRVIRNGKVVYNGEINNLKHEKENVKEISSGKECGITVKRFNDIKIGDIIEAYLKVLQN